MTGSNSFWFAKTGAAGFYNNVIGQSLKIDYGSDAYLNRTLGTATNRAKYTLSWWMKPGITMTTGSSATIFDSGSSGSNYTFIYLSDGKTLACNGVSGGSNSYALGTGVALRDPTSWYHCMFVYDSAQATDTDRIYFIVNGTRITSTTGSPIYPTQSANDPHWNNSGAHYIGYGGGAVNLGDYDGYLADIYHIDGQALDADDFTELKNGTRIPKEYTGTFGNNGFHLNFKKEVASATGYSHYFSGSYTTFSNASHYDIGSSDDFTLEFFHKSAMSDNPNTLGYYQTAGPHFMFQFSGTSNVYMYTGNGAARTFTAGGDASYTANAWNHTAIVRSSGTMKCYINGYQTTAGTTSYSDTTAWDTDRFGIGSGHPGQPSFTGWITNVRLVVGSAVYTSNFTPSTTPLTNITNTKLLACQTATLTKDNSSNDVTGTTSGTISVYTDSPFTGGSPFYNDKSGTGNHFSHTNAVPNDVILDNPENNFCTLNPLQPSGNAAALCTLSEGSLKATNGSSAYGQAMGNLGVKTGKWYTEFYINSAGYPSWNVGWTRSQRFETFDGSNQAGLSFLAYMGYFTSSNVWFSTFGSSSLADPSVAYSGLHDAADAPTTGDVIQCAVDFDNGKMWFGINGQYVDVGSGEGNPASDSNPSITWTASTYADEFKTPHINTYAGTISLNCGQDSSFNSAITAGGNKDGNDVGDFKYAVPSGFLALCTANLPEPTLGPNSDELPNQHYQNYLFTGDSNSTRTISGLNFQPDLLWSKARNQGFSHRIYDSTRGADKGFVLAHGATLYAIESTHDVFDGFTSDGYRTTTDGSAGDLLNYNTGTYINWLWRANAGSTTTNDASATSVGDIDSVYQANTTAGFSIVQWTGTGSAGGIAHGLGAVPHFILIKNRTHNSGNGSGTNWVVYHKEMDETEPQDYSLYISTAGRGDYVNMFQDTAPTSTTFNVGTHMTVNSGDPNYYMAYVWTEIENFSRFGLYYGNGSTNGPVVNVGFRPALLVVKNRDTTGWWAVTDSGRSTFNEVANTLAWDGGYSESTLTSDLKVDFLSNGFKIRDTDGYYNSNGAEYIYAAWAEMPAKYANAF